MSGTVSQELRTVVDDSDREPEGIGWCSSCDSIHEVKRPTCPKCGDWLIFTSDDAAKADSVGDGWISVPDSAGYWWHWDGDADHKPFMYSVLTSMSRKINREFIQYPDGRWCCDVGGLWMKIAEPVVPSPPQEEEKSK